MRAIGWLPRAWIPNEDGKKILILTSNLMAEPALVRRDPQTGLHSLVSLAAEPIHIRDVMGWTPFPSSRRSS
jgi:hypothetical protein